MADAQTLAALAIVALAVIYLVVRSARGRAKPACAECDGCRTPVKPLTASRTGQLHSLPKGPGR